MIKQKTVIEINSKKPIDQLGNHVLFYDSTKKCYYAMTLEEFLAPQNIKIKELEKDIENYKSLIDQTLVQIRADVQDFKDTMQQEKQEFLAQYKETNGKIIEMVKSFINIEGE